MNRIPCYYSVHKICPNLDKVSRVEEPTIQSIKNGESIFVYIPTEVCILCMEERGHKDSAQQLVELKEYNKRRKENETD